MKVVFPRGTYQLSEGYGVRCVGPRHPRSPREGHRWWSSYARKKTETRRSRGRHAPTVESHPKPPISAPSRSASVPPKPPTAPATYAKPKKNDGTPLTKKTALGRVCGFAGLRPSTAVKIRRSRPSRSRGSTRGSARRRVSPRRARVSHQGSGGAGNPTRRRTPLRVPGAPPDSRGGRLPDRPRSMRRPAPLVSDLRQEAHSTG